MFVGRLQRSTFKEFYTCIFHVQQWYSLPDSKSHVIIMTKVKMRWHWINTTFFENVIDTFYKLYNCIVMELIPLLDGYFDNYGEGYKYNKFNCSELNKIYAWQNNVLLFQVLYSIFVIFWGLFYYLKHRGVIQVLLTVIKYII